MSELGEKKYKEIQKKIKNSKCFIVIMSKGENIPIDEEELPQVLKAREEGKDQRVKQGIINMAFYVQVREDKKRKDNSLDKNWNNRFQIENEQKEPSDGLIPLKDIFKNVKLKSPLIKRLK